MHVCPNCCKDLVSKKYKMSKHYETRLKCLDCGYETSEREIQQEALDYLESKKQEDKNRSEEY